MSLAGLPFLIGVVAPNILLKIIIKHCTPLLTLLTPLVINLICYEVTHNKLLIITVSRVQVYTD